jgi:D-alanyl-D-alanine carboxypeptidase
VKPGNPAHHDGTVPLPYLFRFSLIRSSIVITSVCAALSLATARADAEALLLVEVETGKVLHAENATYPWYPASVTKIMTAYVTLRAVKEGRISLDTPLTVSANAASAQPTKMGFAPGTTVTVDNALKMIMVKSANDVSVVLAEGIYGSVEKFADEMNRTAKRLGMTQSNWVNPNGLPADEQVTSARDLAILARAVLREFPGHDAYWNIPAIRYGKRTMRNHNSLIGRYPGADGMKTGFICASGFNVVATASRNGKRLIAVVLGSPSSGVRAVKTAQLLERGFNQSTLSWLTPSLGTVDALIPISAAPPNLRDEMCGKHRKRPASEEAEDESLTANVPADSPYAIFLSSLRAPNAKPGDLLHNVDVGPPVVVFTGAAKKPATTQLAAKPDPKAAPVNSAAAPWTNLSPSSLAASPPSSLTTATEAVPMPRGRPKIATATATAVPKKKQKKK